MSDDGKIKTLKSLPYETVRKIIKMGGCLQVNSVSAWQVVFRWGNIEYYFEAANDIRGGQAELDKEPKVYEIATCLSPPIDSPSILRDAFVRVLLEKIVNDKHVFGVLLDEVIRNRGWKPIEDISTAELLEMIIKENAKTERKQKYNDKTIDKEKKETSKSEVPIHFDDIFWKIHAELAGKDGENKLVKLSWGWTAGMSEEDLKDCAEDAPQGHQSVITTLEFAKELRDQLDEIIQENEGEK